MLLCLFSTFSFAKTTVCEITFYTNNVKYDCLMVLHDTESYGNNYMRVAYTLSGNYIVINQQLSLEKQLLPDGNTYVTASGYNVRFISNNPGITYNPDRFSVLINAAGVIDQPKIGDSRNAMMPVSSYRDVSNQTLDYNYLKRFFIDGESELVLLSQNSSGFQQPIATPNYNSNQNSYLLLENNTKNIVYASYVIFDKNENCFVSRGWYEVNPYGNLKIDFGDYQGIAYVHGTHRGLLTNLSWGDGFKFCTDPINKYRILYADQNNCINKASYSQLKIVPGANKFIFNP